MSDTQSRASGTPRPAARSEIAETEARAARPGFRDESTPGTARNLKAALGGAETPRGGQGSTERLDEPAAAGRYGLSSEGDSVELDAEDLYR